MLSPHKSEVTGVPRMYSAFTDDGYNKIILSHVVGDRCDNIVILHLSPPSYWQYIVVTSNPIVEYDGGDRCKKTILSHLSPTTCDNIMLLHPSSVNVEYILGKPVTSDLWGDNIFLSLSALSGDNTCLMFIKSANWFLLQTCNLQHLMYGYQH